MFGPDRSRVFQRRCCPPWGWSVNRGTKGSRTPPLRGGGLRGDECPPSRFSKADELKFYPRPVSIWCPPAHKAITMFLSDRCRSSIRITAFYGALPLRHAGFFFSPIGNRTREFGLCVLFLCFLSPALATTTPHRQSSASR